MARYLLLFLLFTGCGKSVPHEIDPFFNPYIEKFKKDADAAQMKYGDFDNITVMKFEDLNNGVDTNKNPFVYSETSECRYRNEKNYFEKEFHKEIIFDKSIRYYVDDLIYKIFLHEVGHCSYHLGHTYKNYTYIMSPIVNRSSPSLWNGILHEYFEEALTNEFDWNNEGSPL